MFFHPFFTGNYILPLNSHKVLTILSQYYHTHRKDALSGEEAIADHTQDVEAAAVQLLISQELHTAFKLMTDSERWIITELYLARPPKTLRQLSAESGIPVMTLQDRKKKALKNLREKIF